MSKKFLILISVLMVSVFIGACVEEESSTPQVSTPQKVICPSCGDAVNSLIRREVYKGNGDWKEWCSDCWREFDDLSVYDYE